MPRFRAIAAPKLGVTDNLVRLSVGVETYGDLAGALARPFRPERGAVRFDQKHVVSELLMLRVLTWVRQHRWLRAVGGFLPRRFRSQTSRFRGSLGGEARLQANSCVGRRAGTRAAERACDAGIRSSWSKTSMHIFAGSSDWPRERACIRSACSRAAIR